MPVAAMSLQRKKSLPDVTQPIQLTATAPLSREEASVLSSMRREEVRRQIDEHERLKANPLLYLVSPQVKVSVQVPEGERERDRVWERKRSAFGMFASAQRDSLRYLILSLLSRFTYNYN